MPRKMPRVIGSGMPPLQPPINPAMYGGDGPRIPSPDGGFGTPTDSTIGGIRPNYSPNEGMMPLGMPGPRGMNGQMPPVKMGDAPMELPTMPFSLSMGDQVMDQNRRKFKGLNPPPAIF